VAKSRSLPTVTEYDSLLVSTTDPSMIFLGTQHGLFESVDGGRSWNPAGLDGEAVTSLSQIGKTILAGGDGLFASSTNEGETWQHLHPRGLPSEQIDALAADSDRSIVYVAVVGWGLYRSTDRARSFRAVSHLVGPAIRALALTAKHILAGDVANGVYVSSNGLEWQHTAHGMVMALAVSGENQQHVLAASWGIARSSDGGRLWTTTLHSHALFGAVAWAPGNSSLAYAVGDNHSFWRSSDGGVHWSRRSTG
jgi:photosystem II stability/assembly factor-like uncharacterized protein